MFERYRVFHDIVTHCDLSSMQSVLRLTLDELIRELNGTRGAYCAVAAGGMRCMVARNSDGTDVSNHEDVLPWDILFKVPNTRQHYAAKMPVTPKNRNSTSSFNRFEIKNMLAVPTVFQSQVVGVGYVERKSQMPPYQPGEIKFFSDVFQDIELVLSNSRKVERQTFEIHQMKDEIAISKINMISKHSSMLRLFKQIAKLAKVPSTVMIHGESGTGKELVGRAIYNLSGLKGPYIATNCGAIEPNLMKSELFGHLKGSFTGAHKDREGLFKKAEGGVLFMDEIGEMAMDIQVALLRTLEQGEIVPVGADRPQVVRTRVVAATHRDLTEMVQAGKFRNDLFQRLRGITLYVPPLRERRSDIPLLAEHFLSDFNSKLGLSYKGFREEALETLMDRDYRDGNVRELKHIIERAMVFEDDPDLIGQEFLGEQSSAGAALTSEEGEAFDAQVDAFARQVIERAIEASNGNKTKAMKKLGLARTTFYSMINKYGIKDEGGLQ